MRKIAQNTNSCVPRVPYGGTFLYHHFQQMDHWCTVLARDDEDHEALKQFQGINIKTLQHA